MKVELSANELASLRYLLSNEGEYLELRLSNCTFQSVAASIKRRLAADKRLYAKLEAASRE